jgi:hypothetical protein
MATKFRRTGKRATTCGALAIAIIARKRQWYEPLRQPVPPLPEIERAPTTLIAAILK